MAKTKYESLGHEMDSVGFLSLSKAVVWLKIYHTTSRISYPTALKLVTEGKIQSIRIGSIHRIYKKELLRFIEHGNREVD